MASADLALADLGDDALLCRLQEGAFSYFQDSTNPDNGLVQDTSRDKSPCSIAVVGMALTCYPIAVERGWMSRADAAAITLKTLQFFWNSRQGDAANATGYKGFYYHFLDMKSGLRAWQCELSLIDTAILLAGMLTAARYFDGHGTEADIRELVDALYGRVDWEWAQNGGETLSQGWKPECGFLHNGWEGYNEASILYVLALGSATHPPRPACFAGWTQTYQWEQMLGESVLYSGPLFTHLFSHAWIDFRGIRDAFMREKGSDYFENTVGAIGVHREYAARNPKGYAGYGRDFWGITAGDGPGDKSIRQAGRNRRFYGYTARGVPYGPDDGTIAPWAMLATLAFAKAPALQGARHLLRTYPQVCTRDRFSSGFNPTLTPATGGWLSDGWYGLDQGLLVIMIENDRSGLVWDLTRASAPIRSGLKAAGFEGAWLG